MQKIVNAIAIASGAVSLAVVGLGGYVFIRKDAIIDNIKSKVMESVLPSGIGGLSGAGLDIPKFSNPMAAPDAPSRETKPSAPSVGLPPMGF
jgi:hypothetical protein